MDACRQRDVLDTIMYGYIRSFIYILIQYTRATNPHYQQRAKATTHHSVGLRNDLPTSHNIGESHQGKREQRWKDLIPPFPRRPNLFRHCHLRRRHPVSAVAVANTVYKIEKQSGIAEWKQDLYIRQCRNHDEIIYICIYIYIYMTRRYTQYRSILPAGH